MIPASERIRKVIYPVEHIVDCRRASSRQQYPTLHSEDVEVRPCPLPAKASGSWMTKVVLPTPDSWFVLKDATPKTHMCRKVYGDGRVETVCSYYGDKMGCE